MTHVDRQTRGLRVLQARIERFKLDENPITAVLEITFHMNVREPKNRPALRKKLMNDFVQTLSAGVTICRPNMQQFVCIPFEPAFLRSTHFTTRSARNEAVVALYVKTVATICCDKWKQSIQENNGLLFGIDAVEEASVTFCVSKPLVYFEQMSGAPPPLPSPRVAAEEDGDFW